MTMMKKRSVASEGMTATPDQSLCSSSQKSAREVIGQITEWLPLVKFEEIATSTCPPATQLHHYIDTTVTVAGIMSISLTLQQCRMEDPKKPNVLEELDQFMGNTEEKMFQSLFPEMGGAGEVLPGHQEPLVQAAARRAVWRYARGSHAHN